MDIVLSHKLPEHKISFIVEKLANGKLIVWAKDNKSFWKTTPFDALDDVKDYLKKWIGSRAVLPF